MKKTFKSSSRSLGRAVPISSSNVRRPASERSASLPRNVSPVARSSKREYPDLILPIDRRHYYPSSPDEPISRPHSRPAKRFSGQPARVVAPPIQEQPKRRSVPAGKPAKLIRPSALLFQAPQNVAVCVQRGIRKEVLHAKGVAGKTNLKAPKRGPYSGVSCGTIRRNR